MFSNLDIFFFSILALVILPYLFSTLLLFKGIFHKSKIALKIGLTLLWIQWLMYLFFVFNADVSIRDAILFCVFSLDILAITLISNRKWRVIAWYCLVGIGVIALVSAVAISYL